MAGRQVRHHPLASYPPALGDVSDVVGDVTSWLAELENGLAGAKTQLTKIDNAIKGAATGAQVGYNAPTDWKSLAIGAIVIVGGILLIREIA